MSHLKLERVFLSLVLLAVVAADASAAPQAVSAPAPHMVFVCEHGAAKSLIAMAYFNKLAAERGLAARASFRGIDPRDALSVRVVAGLKADGLAVPDGRPTAIAAADVAAATHIFAIGCSLPQAATTSGARPNRGTTCLTTKATGRCVTPSSAMCAHCSTDCADRIGTVPRLSDLRAPGGAQFYPARPGASWPVRLEATE